MKIIKSLVVILSLVVLASSIRYDYNLKVGNLTVNLPKTPPKNRAIKNLYTEAELFAYRYDKRLRNIQNSHSRKVGRSLKKFETDFNKDFNHLKRHLRNVKNENFNPTVNDATLFQLVNEFVRKLGMIPMQTHCFIYGCPNGIPVSSISPSYTSQPSISVIDSETEPVPEPENLSPTEENNDEDGDDGGEEI